MKEGLFLLMAAALATGGAWAHALGEKSQAPAHSLGPAHASERALGVGLEAIDLIQNPPDPCAPDGDGIVWGTDCGGDNIVWGD